MRYESDNCQCSCSAFCVLCSVFCVAFCVLRSDPADELMGFHSSQHTCSHWLQMQLHVLINTPMVLVSQWARFSLHRFKIQTIFCAAPNVSESFSCFNYDSAVVYVHCKMSFTSAVRRRLIPLCRVGGQIASTHASCFKCRCKFKPVQIKVINRCVLMSNLLPTSDLFHLWAHIHF